MRFASLAQPERRSERLSAFEIMMRVSPSVQYVGAEPWKATPRPSSRDGRLLSDGRSLYELHTARIWRERMDRKSTRLNSSHGYISYAVFCLKKKKNTNTI